MISTRTYNAHSQEETKQLARQLASCVQKGDVITLQGDLGSGKTTFARYFIHALTDLDPKEITSPTFTLVQTYPIESTLTLWHYDLYRLEDANEIEELALEDALNDGITLIEWPELVMDLLTEAQISIQIDFGKRETDRSFTISANESVLNTLT